MPSRATTSPPHAGLSETAPPAARPASSQRSSTSPNASCAATSPKPSYTHYYSSAPSSNPRPPSHNRKAGRIEPLATTNLPPELRLLVGIRVVIGAGLLIAPDTLLGDLLHQRIDRPERAFARILGARHLAQATIIARHHTREWILAGAVVDASHATSMALLAAVKPDRRKLALTNVVSATMFAASGVCEARHVATSPSSSSGGPRRARTSTAASPSPGTRCIAGRCFRARPSNSPRSH